MHIDAIFDAMMALACPERGGLYTHTIYLLNVLHGSNSDRSNRCEPSLETPFYLKHVSQVASPRLPVFKAPNPPSPYHRKMSAPTSPLPKRVKPNPQPTMASSTETSVPVTNVEAAPALLIKKLSDKARLPKRGSAFAAGYDLYAARDTVVPARGKVLVDTDLSMAVPAGTCTLRPL